MDFHADVDFSPTERSCLEASAQQWREQTQGIADVGFVYDYKPKDPKSIVLNLTHNKLIKWSSTTPKVEEVEAIQEDPSYELLGLTMRSGGLDSYPRLPTTIGLVMDRLQDDHMCRLTVIHELGHAFGIHHMVGNSNIMYPSVDIGRTACLKHDDLLAFCFANDCGNVEMKQCAYQTELDDQ